MRLIKIDLFLALLILTLILFGCDVAEESGLGEEIDVGVEKEVEEPAIEEDVEESGKETFVEEEEGLCTSGWKCISKWYKAYQLADCSWKDKKECTLGCVNGTCVAAETCASGFKCINENEKGFQTETCSWIKTKKCDWGCEDGECKPASTENETADGTVNQTTSEEEEAEEEIAEEAVEEDVKMLYLNAKDVIEVDGEEHNLSIYNIELDWVRLDIDGKKTGWLGEGDNFTSVSGVTIIIKEILFQPYVGGTKAVGYTVE